MSHCLRSKRTHLAAGGGVEEGRLALEGGTEARDAAGEPLQFRLEHRHLCCVDLGERDAYICTWEGSAHY